MINSDDIKTYLNSKYAFIFSERSFVSLINISKVIGGEKFIKGELEFTESLNNNKTKEKSADTEIALNNTNSSSGNEIKTIEEETEDFSEDLINFFIKNFMKDKQKTKLKHLEFSYDKMILSQAQRKNKKRRNKI